MFNEIAQTFYHQSTFHEEKKIKWHFLVKVEHINIQRFAHNLNGIKMVEDFHWNNFAENAIVF